MERKMRGHDAAAGNRRDVRDLTQDARIAQEADEAKMIQGRAKSAARQSQPEFHGRLNVVKGPNLAADMRLAIFVRKRFGLVAQPCWEMAEC
jgi:hypothetical protein